LDDEADELRESIIRRARTEGVAAAYEASLAICKDPAAPQQAKSNAARTLLQIGGLFEESKEPRRKELQEMTFDELKAERRRLRASRSPMAKDDIFD
jgi:hypothetical protein